MNVTFDMANMKNTVVYKLYRAMTSRVGMKTIQLMKKQTNDEVAPNLSLSNLYVNVT